MEQLDDDRVAFGGANLMENDNIRFHTVEEVGVKIAIGN